jgi:hypothetical protein
VAGRNLEADPFAGFQQLSGRNAFGTHTVSLQVGLKLVQRRLVEHLEGEEIDPGPIGLAQDDAVVIALVPAFQIDPPLRIAAGFDQPQHVTVVTNAFLKIQHANLRMPRTQNTCHCHSLVSSFYLMT